MFSKLAEGKPCRHNQWREKGIVAISVLRSSEALKKKNIKNKE